MSNRMIDAGAGRQVPVSRRSALRTGGLAAIAASLLGTTTAPVAAQTPALAPLPWLGSVAAPDLADLTAECERLHDRCRETLHEAARLDDKLAAVLTYEQRTLAIAADSTLGNHHSATIDWYMAEIGRHLPGIAPAIFAVWEHVREELGSPGVCCFPDPTGDASASSSRSAGTASAWTVRTTSITWRTAASGSARPATRTSCPPCR